MESHWQQYLKAVQDYDRYLSPYINGPENKRNRLLHFVSLLSLTDVTIKEKEWGELTIYFSWNNKPFVMERIYGTPFGTIVFDISESIVFDLTHNQKELYEPFNDPKYKNWVWSGLTPLPLFQSKAKKTMDMYHQSLSENKRNLMDQHLVKLQLFSSKLETTKRNDRCPCESGKKYKNCCQT